MELFDKAHLCICLFVYSTTKSQPKAVISLSVEVKNASRIYLWARALAEISAIVGESVLEIFASFDLGK